MVKSATYLTTLENLAVIFSKKVSDQKHQLQLDLLAKGTSHCSQTGRITSENLSEPDSPRKTWAQTPKSVPQKAVQ
jgi:hypothetical protein